MINLAIISTNKNKYSETFIRSHILLLKANIFLLFDGYLPAKYSGDKGVSEKNFEKTSVFGKAFPTKTGNSVLRRSIKSYLEKNSIDVVLSEYGPCGVEMMEICEDLNIPLVVHFHGYDAYRNDILNSYGQRYAQLFTKAAAIICVSEDMKRQLTSLGCAASKIALLPYGVDSALFSKKESFPKDIDFVFCGRFVPKKAPDKLIESFKYVNSILPETKLYMIGDGALLDGCKRSVLQSGLKQSVAFCGVLSQADISAIFDRSRVYVQHSLKTDDNDSEGTPLAILEAGASGLPVVSTRHGGIADAVLEGRTGYLVEENDVTAFSERMLFLARHPEEAVKLGTQAAAHMLHNYSMDRYIHALQLIIENTLV